MNTFRNKMERVKSEDNTMDIVLHADILQKGKIFRQELDGQMVTFQIVDIEKFFKKDEREEKKQPHDDIKTLRDITQFRIKEKNFQPFTRDEIYDE